MVLRNKLVITVYFTFLVLMSCGDDKHRHKAERAIKKIEQFQEKNSRYPNSLNEIGIISDESGPIFYQLEDSTSYIIYYGTGLGDSEIYYSTTKTWGKGDKNE